MVAYQAESDLVRLVEPQYARAEDEGRTLIQSVLAAPADLELTADELLVRVASLSSPHSTHAVEALCAELNTRTTRFPGTRLRLRFAIAHPVHAWA